VSPRVDVEYQDHLVTALFAENNQLRLWVERTSRLDTLIQRQPDDTSHDRNSVYVLWECPVPAFPGAERVQIAIVDPSMPGALGSAPPHFEAYGWWATEGGFFKIHGESEHRIKVMMILRSVRVVSH
jgi:hypothetical protein